MFHFPISTDRYLTPGVIDAGLQPDEGFTNASSRLLAGGDELLKIAHAVALARGPGEDPRPVGEHDHISVS
jgi:hypothetical protein